MSNNLPVIHLELSSGEFKIRTQDAIYQIAVTPDNSLVRVVEKVVEKEPEKQARPAWDAPDCPPANFSDADAYFKGLSEELYSEVGRLARQLSLSIKEIPGADFKGINIQQTGIELEDAKGQLEDIVQMTEKATMDIMDLAESIQDDLQSVEGSLGSLKDLDFMARDDADGLDWGDPLPEVGPPEEPESDEAAARFIESLIAREEAVKSALVNLPKFETVETPPPPPVQKTAVQNVKTYRFDVDVVFQTLYELCTNETVKDHIKAMRADQTAAFDGDAVLRDLAEAAPNVDVEDNFFNFSIPTVLKTLHQASRADKYKQILKKMNQTSATIFLDAILPLEGDVSVESVETPAAAPAASPAPESAAAKPGLTEEQISGLVDLVESNIADLLAEKSRLEALQANPAAAMSGSPQTDPDFTRVKTEDREKVIDTVANSSQTVDRIMANITRILEALSFQDLSGQRILKIVRLISDVQVQLLSILVSFGAKIKHLQDDAVKTASGDTEKLAQTEVDKMLERVSHRSELEGPGGEDRLDQEAVNNLLAEMGF